jgi:hypothetical protein
MVVYVVYEEDRGEGVSLVGVYSDREAADRVAAQSGRFYVLGSAEVDAEAV